MKEHPILFSGEMVRAILDGRKTQTRRVIKPQPEINDGLYLDTRHRFEFYGGGYPDHGVVVDCPYGAPGDLLWVRETWQYCPFCGGVNWRASANEAGRVCHHCDGDLGVVWKPSIHMPRWASRIMLRVVDVRVERLQEISHEDALAEGIETDIWDQAAVARNYAKPDSWFQMWSSDLPDYVDLDNLYIESFRTLWNSINAARGFGWDVNPWVWVVEFEKVQ